MVAGAPESMLERARIAKKERRLKDAAELLGEALTECAKGDDHAMRALLYEELAYVERGLRDLEDSARHYLDASEIYRSLENLLKTAHTIRHAADVLRELTKLDEAAPLYTEALEIYRGHKDTPPLDLANAIRGFALLKELDGDREGALNLWREARGLYEGTGVEAGVSESNVRIRLLSSN